MQPFKNKNTGPDEDKKHDHPSVEEETIEFQSAKSSMSDAAADVAAQGEQLLRLQAEMQNVRNRTAREIADVRKYAALPVMTDLLPVVDNIDRAIGAAEKAGEAENLLTGFRLVKQHLHTVLNRYD